MRILTSVCNKIDFSGLGWYVEHGQTLDVQEFCEWVGVDFIDPAWLRGINEHAAGLLPGQILLIDIIG